MNFEKVVKLKMKKQMSSGATDLESALQKQEEELRLLDMELENDAQEQRKRPQPIDIYSCDEPREPRAVIG